MGGLVGCATAVALAQHAHTPLKVCILEQSTQLHRVGAAIGLYPNGLAALQYICPALHDEVQSTAIPSRYFERRNLQDEVVKLTDVQEIQATSPVYYPWYKLQQGFTEALESMDSLSNVVLQWGFAFESYEIQPDGAVAVQCKDTINSNTTVTTVTCRVLIGADGMYSAVRKQMQKQAPTPTTTRLRSYDKVMYRAVLPMDDNDNHDLPRPPPAGTQISYQGDEPGQSFSWRETLPGIMTITAAVVVKDSSDKPTPSNRQEQLQAHFSHYPEAVQSIIQALKSENIHISRVRDVESVPESWANQTVALIGDAAHAMTPYMGQGANMGLEDVCVLVHFLIPVLTKPPAISGSNGATTTTATRTAHQIADVLQDYVQERHARVTAVHAQSRRNALQSNTFDKKSAGTPFARRAYTAQFKKDLYEWRPPTLG